MKKNQVAWLNNNSDLRAKSRQFQLARQQSAKQQLATAREQSVVAEETEETEETEELVAFTDAPVFNDPRCHRDRRLRQSIFFSTFRDRRSQTRRGVCSLDTNWWISRNYCQKPTE